MSARNTTPSVAGLNGHDHGFRETIAPHYQASAINKYRLKWCIFFHCVLTCVMAFKLSPYVLDKLNIFILFIEEIGIPDPSTWEWIWFGGILTIVMELDAMKRNSVSIVRYYIIATVLTGFLPLIVPIYVYFEDVCVFFSAEPGSRYSLTHEYFLTPTKRVIPIGVLWYGFVFLACQVHGFSIFFCYKLLKAWSARGLARQMERRLHNRPHED